MPSGKSTSWKNGFLLLLFNNTSYTLVGDAGGLLKSVTDGSLYFSLHTADPSSGGLQTSNEVAYTSYARSAVVRTSSGFTVSGSTVTNVSNILWPAPTGANTTALYWGLGTALSGGAGKLLYSGTLASVPIGFALGESTDDSITIKNHALSVDDRVMFSTMAGLSIPTGITDGTVYFVKSVTSADTFTISTTSGGTTVDITVDGNALAYKVLPYLTTTGIQPVIPVGGFKINED